MLFGIYLRFTPKNSRNKRFSDVFTQRITAVRLTTKMHEQYPQHSEGNRQWVGDLRMIEKYILALREYVMSHDPVCSGGESIWDMLYECHNENFPYDNNEIKADFNELYQQMSGISLRDMDKVIYPVCKLFQDHEKAGSLKVSKLVFIFPQKSNNRRGSLF